MSDLEDVQYDRSVELQITALDDEYARYEKFIKSQSDLIDQTLEAIEQKHDQTVANMEKVHNALIDSLEREQKAAADSLEASYNATVANLKATRAAIFAIINSSFNATIASIQTMLQTSFGDLSSYINSVQNQAVTAANSIANAFDIAYAKGKSVADIKFAQQQLTDAGYDIGNSGVDGIWGKNTNTAFLKSLQESLLNAGYSLSRFGADGKFGSETKNAIHQAAADGYLTPDLIKQLKNYGYYHAGGIVGNQPNNFGDLLPLTPDEMLIKALKGEAVITKAQQAAILSALNIGSGAVKSFGTLSKSVSHNTNNSQTNNTAPSLTYSPNIVIGSATKSDIASLESALKKNMQDFYSNSLKHLSFGKNIPLKSW